MNLAIASITSFLGPNSLGITADQSPMILAKFLVRCLKIGAGVHLSYSLLVDTTRVSLLHTFKCGRTNLVKMSPRRRQCPVK